MSAGLWDSVTLAAAVSRHAASRGGKVAVVDQLGERRHTYSDLDRDSNRIARYLRRNGVRPGDVVGVQLPNWYEMVVIAVGIFKAGAVINPMLPGYRSKELRYMLQVGEAKVIFTPGVYRGFDYLAMVEDIRDELPSLVAHVVVDGIGGRATTYSEAMAIDAPAPHPDQQIAEEVSELIFTSGTEAEPKAVMHTEQTTNFSVRTAFKSLGMSCDDVVWMPSPIGHSTGFNYGVRMALYHGLRLVLQDQWDGNQAVHLIQEEGCSYTLAATTFLRDLVRACRAANVRLDSMRLFGSGGAPVPGDLVLAANEVGISVLRLYGSTEVLVGTWNRTSSKFDKRVNTDGCAVDDVEVAVRDDAGRTVAGQPGELYVRGPNTSVGFFNDPVRTSATFVEGGWIKSGDLAVLDDEGYLTMVGRRKEIIIRGGLNVTPREVEEVLLRLPAVVAVAVVGLPDERLGEIACACVVLAPAASLTHHEMLKHLQASGLATYKWPERLEIVDELPTTPTGKVQKHVLVASLAAQRTAFGDRV
ncbi:MAG TPA: AMP-binding protein [Candidatus Acidoferrum sp.]|nr:AMP-binding protein [Candidatus Acidoferrum sp.]